MSLLTRIEEAINEYLSNTTDADPLPSKCKLHPTTFAEMTVEASQRWRTAGKVMPEGSKVTNMQAQTGMVVFEEDESVPIGEIIVS